MGGYCQSLIKESMKGPHRKSDSEMYVINSEFKCKVREFALSVFALRVFALCVFVRGHV